MAQWLNNTFASFDSTIFDALAYLAEHFGGFLTPLMSFITFSGEKGILMILIALSLMLFKKTRMQGICVFGAVGCGAIVTNFILKDLVERPRPFMEAGSICASRWLAFGFPNEDGFSFPSGHVTAAMGAVTAFVFMSRHKGRASLAFIYVFFISISRCYLLAHYPSDVLAAIVVGAFSATVAFLITKGICTLLEKYKDNKFCDFVINFSITDIKK